MKKLMSSRVKVFLCVSAGVILCLVNFWLSGVLPARPRPAGAAPALAATMSLESVKIGQVIQINGRKYVKISRDKYLAAQEVDFCDDGLAVGETQDFAYTGGEQEFTLCSSHSYRVELWGAQGGWFNEGNYNFSSTSFGGYTSGIISPASTYKVYFYVGAQGTSGVASLDYVYNGGGKGYIANAYGPGPSGGGATDVRTVSGMWNNISGLRSRIMVAGGGGGQETYKIIANTNGNESAGGGLTARGGYWAYATDNSGYSSPSVYATGGNQVTGGVGAVCGRCNSLSLSGSFGIGGYINCVATYVHIIGGGGGWYGGGGGGNGHNCFMSGGGGSSYISGHTGCVAVTSLDNTTPKSGCTTGTSDKNCSLSPTELVFTDTTMIDGTGYAWSNVKGGLQFMPNPDGGYYASGTGHTGNGYARITRLN